MRRKTTSRMCVCGVEMQPTAFQPAVEADSRRVMYCSECGHFDGGFRKHIPLTAAAVSLGIEDIEWEPDRWQSLRYRHEDGYVDLYSDGSFSGYLNGDVATASEMLVAMTRQLPVNGYGEVMASD